MARYSVVPGGRTDNAIEAVKSVGRAARTGAMGGAVIGGMVTSDSGNPALNMAAGAGIGAIASGVKDIVAQSRGRKAHLSDGIHGARR